MSFTRIDDEPLRADNLSGTGAVYYLRWHDAQGTVYVQITEIVGGHGAGNGSFSKLLYLFSEIKEVGALEGYELTGGPTRVTNDNNMSGYLRAAKIDIIRRTVEQTETDLD